MLGSRIDLPKKISSSSQENMELIRRVLGGNMDIIIRDLTLGNGQKIGLFYLEGLVNKDILGRDIITPMQQAAKKSSYTAEELARTVLHTGGLVIMDDMVQVIEGVLQGLAALVIDGDTRVLMAEVIGWPQRSVNEPGTDVVVRGPREGFIEGMRSNVALLRRKIHHPDLRVETVRLGRYSRTDAALIYVDSIADKSVLALAKKRLAAIDIDAVLDSGQVEQLIQDTPYSVFPTIGITEKPDIAAAKIMEGRIAIVVDGSPMVLTVPMLFVEGLQSPEDYYTRFYYGSWVRILRTLAVFVSIFMPGIFVAAATWHQQVIPFRLFLSIAAGEAQTPFSVGFSLLLIGFVYEILREAGIRLPKPAGQAISIVGAIVMGDAAVSAGLISASVLIVLAVTVIASFVTVVFTDAFTLLRLVFLVLGWVSGFLGMAAGILFLLVYLASMESFGAAYFSPLGPMDIQGLKDTVIRAPLWNMKFRPLHLSANKRRMADMRRRRP